MDNSPLDDQTPTPEGELISRTLVTAVDISSRGDVDAGWVLNLMDTGSRCLASHIADGKVTTVAVSSMVFLRPIPVDCIVSIFGFCAETGGSSIRINIEVWLQTGFDREMAKVTEGEFVCVAVDEQGRTRAIQN